MSKQHVSTLETNKGVITYRTVNSSKKHNKKFTKTFFCETRRKAGKLEKRCILFFSHRCLLNRVYDPVGR